MPGLWMSNVSMGSDKLYKPSSSSSRPISIPSQYRNPYQKQNVDTWIEDRIRKVNRKEQIRSARNRLRKICLCVSALFVFLLFMGIVGIILWVILANKDNSAGYCMLVTVEKDGLEGGSFPASISSDGGKEFQTKFCTGMSSIYGSTMTKCSVSFIQIEDCFAVVDSRVNFRFEVLEKRVLQEKKLLTNENVASVLQLMFNEGKAKSADTLMKDATFLRVASCKVTGTITYKYEVDTAIDASDHHIHNSISTEDGAKLALCTEVEYALSSSTLGDVYKKCIPWGASLKKENSQIKVAAEFEVTYDKATLLEAAKNREKGVTVKGYTRNQLAEQIKKKPSDYPLTNLVLIAAESALDTGDSTTEKDEDQRTEYDTYARNMVTTKRTKCKLQ